MLLMSNVSNAQYPECFELPQWQPDAVYAQAGIKVVHQDKVYENKWWTTGEDPSQSGEWGVWRFLYNCTQYVPPTVAITSPTDNSAFVVGETITIAADASDADGFVTKVEFFNGPTLIAIDNTAPYTASLTLQAAGSYVLTAMATDNDNVTSTSTPVNINMVATTPSVSITSPANGTQIALGESIELCADATDPDGTIVRVDFYDGTILIGSVTAPPYCLTVTPTIGEHVYTAVAVDNAGNTATSSAVNLTAIQNLPPTCAITSPPEGASFEQNQTITLSADATDAEGLVTQVEFFVDDVSVGVVTSHPYTMPYSTSALGPHTISAAATDNLGATTYANPKNITIIEGTQPDGYKIIMYVTSWSGDPAAFRYDQVTHLNYSFAIPNADGTIPGPDNPAKLQDIVSRAHAAGVKVSLAIGGWLNSSPSATPFETFSQTPAGRANFANACVNLINQYNLDGIDIDWEYPTQPQRWDDLITDVRAAIGSNKLLTAAVAGGNYFGQNFGTATFGLMDWLNIMSYDCSCPTNAPYSYAVEGLDYWSGKGMPVNKLVVGVPFYNQDNTPALHSQKADLVIQRGAAGMMAWELAHDTDGSQLDAIYAKLGQPSGAPIANANGPYSSPDPNVAISFSSAGSNDPDGTIVSYFWEFGDGATSAQANPSHMYAAVGTYTVGLTVTDNDGKSATSMTTAVIGNGGCSYDPWDPAIAYVGGSKVLYQGNVWRAKWWTQGDVPGADPWGPWEDLGVCDGTKAAGINEAIAANLMLLPNPVSGIAHFTFNVEKASIVSLRIIDMQGREVKSLISNNVLEGSQSIELDASELASGLYMYVLQLDQQFEKGRMVVK